MQRTINLYNDYLKNLLILAFPLFIGNLGHNLIGITDVFVVARYNINSLAAISIANSIIFTILIFGLGLLSAISIVLSNLRGTKKGIKKYLPTVIFLSVVLAAFFTLICYSTKYIVPFMGFEQEIIPYICEYISIVSVSMFGMFLFEGIKQFLQAYEIVKLPNFLLILAVIYNLAADIILVFGFGAIPAMGSRGAAIATLSGRLLMGIILFIFIFKFINFKHKIDFGIIKDIVKTGIPIGIALILEFAAFNIITMLLGRSSSLLAAVHSILITISSATFMVPFSLATAVSVKIAYYFGANKPEEIKRYAYTALIWGVGFMAAAGTLMAIFPKEIIKLFTADISVIKTAVPVISILAAYQIFDGLQTVMGGILKGFKLTKTVTISVLIGYWFVGAPIAAFLTYKSDMPLRGFWIALAFSLFAIGFIQAIAAKIYYKNLYLSGKNSII